MSQPLILKLGGELLETAEQRANIGALAASITAERPLVIVHGGGRAIDAELERRGIEPRKIDGLRMTDAATLDVVVSVLAGSANTWLVAALVSHGVAAIGLTGVDAGFGKAQRVADLGAVGDPTEIDGSLIELLLVHGYVPVIASLGIETEDDTAHVLNVNADVMACRMTSALQGGELVIAGSTPGVLDNRQESMPLLDIDGIDDVIANGTATAGMVAKLSACRAALASGIATIRIVDGRGLNAEHGVDEAPGTTLVSAVQSSSRPPYRELRGAR